MDFKESTYTARLDKRRQKLDPLIGEGGKMDQWQKAYFLQHYADPETDEQGAADKHTDTVCMDYINQVKAMMSVPAPVRQFYTDNPESEKAKDLADKAEKYVAGVWRANETRARQRIREAIIWDQMVNGRSYIIVYVDAARLTLYKGEKGLPRDAYMPICIERLNPREVLPNTDPGRWGWTDDVLIAKKLSPFQVARMWGKQRVRRVLANAETLDQDESEESMLDYVETWEFVQAAHDKPPALYAGILYDGKWLIKPRAMDKYADLPIILIPGLSTPSDKLEWQMFSPLVPVLHNASTLEKIMNRVLLTMDYQADPIIMRWLNNTPPEQLVKAPGAVWNLGVGELVNYLSGTGLSNQALQVYQMIAGDLERSSLARVNYGQGAAAWSGYMAQMAITGSTLKNETIAMNYSSGLSAIDQHIMDLSVTFFGDDTVTAYGLQRGKDYIVKLPGKAMEGVKVVTTLTPKAPADEQAKAGLAQMYRTPSQATGLPLFSDDHIRREILGTEDAKAALRDVIRERVMTMPALIKWSTMDWAKKSDLAPDLVQAIQADLDQMLSAQAQPPAGGGPPGPGGPPPGPGGPPPAGPGGPPPAGPGAAPGAGPEMGGPPPGGAMPPEQGAAQGDPAAALRDEIQRALQEQRMPPQIAQQALAMLDQGYPPEQVYAWIEQQAAQQGQGLTMEQVQQMLVQQLGPEMGQMAAQEVARLVQEQSMSVENALRAVVGQIAQSAGGQGAPAPQGTPAPQGPPPVM